MNKFPNIERVMIFIELVRGCENKACPSFKTLCNLGDGARLRFMSESVLEQIIDELLLNRKELKAIGRVDIWAYGCGDSLLHPGLDEAAKKLSVLPFEKTIAIDCNCWRDNTGWGDVFNPVVLFKEGSFDINEIGPLTKKWNKHFKNCRFGFILKNLSNKLLSEIRKIEANHPFIKARSFHHVPLGMNLNYKDIWRYERQSIGIDPSIKNVSRIDCTDKRAIRIMFRSDGSLRRCLVSTTEKTNFKEFLMDNELLDCSVCFPHMAGEQMLIFPDKIIIQEKARCVSDKA